MVSEDDVAHESPPEDSDSGDDLMALSAQAIQGTCAGKTIKLTTHFAKHKAVVLLDSGSSHNFISEQLAACLPNWQLLQKPLQVKVANGSVLICTHEVTCNWLVQGVQFETTFRILPLQCYDAILGMDWLEQFNPMQVHWAEKWLSFTYNGVKVQLKGLTDTTTKLLSLSGDQLNALIRQNDVWCVVQLNALDSAEIEQV